MTRLTLLLLCAGFKATATILGIFDSHEPSADRPVLVAVPDPVDPGLVEDAEVAWLYELFPDAPSFPREVA